MSKLKASIPPRLRWGHPILSAAFAASVLVACQSNDSASPLAPDKEAIELAAVSASNPWVYRVGGGGTGMLELTGQLNNGRLNVRQFADGTVSGSFALHARIPHGQNALGLELEFDIRAEADCLVVDRNQAWVSGPIVSIKRFNVPGANPGPPVGSTFLAIVEREGPSVGSGWFGPPFLVGASDCTDRPAMPPAPADSRINGNFIVQRR